MLVVWIECRARFRIDDATWGAFDFYYVLGAQWFGSGAITALALCWDFYGAGFIGAIA